MVEKIAAAGVPQPEITPNDGQFLKEHQININDFEAQNGQFKEIWKTTAERTKAYMESGLDAGMYLNSLRERESYSTGNVKSMSTGISDRLSSIFMGQSSESNNAWRQYNMRNPPDERSPISIHRNANAGFIPQTSQSPAQQQFVRQQGPISHYASRQIVTPAQHAPVVSLSNKPNRFNPNAINPAYRAPSRPMSTHPNIPLIGKTPEEISESLRQKRAQLLNKIASAKTRDDSAVEIEEVQVMDVVAKPTLKKKR